MNARVEEHRARVRNAREHPAQHEPRHVRRQEILAQVHGTSAAGNFNNRLAVLITRTVGTMWCAYVFLLISLVSFPEALRAFLHGDTLTGVSWLSQSFLQLVLLPIIIVGQNVISAAQDARAETDHETLVALHTMNVRQLELLETQEKILRILEERKPA